MAYSQCHVNKNELHFATYFVSLKGLNSINNPTFLIRWSELLEVLSTLLWCPIQKCSVEYLIEPYTDAALMVNSLGSERPSDICIQHTPTKYTLIFCGDKPWHAVYSSCVVK